MIRIFLTLSFLTFIYTTSLAAESADSIEALKVDTEGKFYITLSSKRTRLERWQSFTGRFLGSYTTNNKSLVDFFIDNDQSMIVGLFTDNIICWDLVTGEMKKAIPWPKEVATMQSSNRSILESYQIADYDPVSNRVALTSGGHILVLDVSTGSIVYSEYTTYIIEQAKLMNNGTSFIGMETVSNEVFLIDLKSKNRKLIYKSAVVMKMSTRKTGDRLVLASGKSWIIYDENLKEIYKGTNEYYFFTETPYFIGKSDLVAYVNGYTSMNVLYPSINFEANFSNEFRISGFDDSNGLLYMWNNTAIAIKQYSGDPFFITDNYRHSKESRVSQHEFHPVDSILISDSGVLLHHDAPVTVFEKANGFIASGDLKGTIYVWNSKGELVKKETMFYDAISSIKFESETKIIAGSIGRAAILNTAQKEVMGAYRGHTHAITAIAISDNGKYLLTCGQDKTVMIWDHSNGSLVSKYRLNHIPMTAKILPSYQVEFINEFNQTERIDCSEDIHEYENPPRRVLVNSSHAARLRSLSFSPDGNTLLTSDEGGVVKIWDVKNLVARTTFSNAPSASHARFTYNGKQILNFSLNTIYVNDARSGKLISATQLQYFTNIGFHDIALLKNNNGVLIANNQSGDQLLYSINSSRFSYAYHSEHNHPPLGIAISPDNNMFATLSSDGIDFIGLNGNKIREINYPNQSNRNMYVVRKIQFSPDGKLIAAACDNNVIIWNVESLQEVSRIVANDFSFIGNERIAYYKVLSDRRNATSVIVQNIYSNEKHVNNEVETDKHSYVSMAYDSVNEIIALGTYEGMIELMDGKTGRFLKESKSKGNSRVSGDFNPVTGALAFSVPGGIKLFDLSVAREKTHINYHHGRLNRTPRLSYTEKGKYLIASDMFGGTFVLDANNFNELQELPATSDFKTSKDEKLLALQKDTGNDIHIFDLETGEERIKIEVDEKKGSVFSYVFSPDNEGFIYVLRKYKSPEEIKKLGKFDKKVDDVIVFYDLKSKSILQETPVTSRDADYLDMSNDGKWIGFKSDYSQVLLIDLNGGKPFVIEHDKSFDFLSFSADSKFLIIGEDDGKLTLYDVNTQKVIHHLVSHTAAISNLSFFQNKLASFSEDGTAIIWDITSGKKLIQISAFESNDYIFINDKNYYTGTKGISSAIYFKDGNNVFPFDQFDLVFNRPDIIIQGLGAPKIKVDAYNEAYLKRIRNLGFNPVDLAANNVSLPLIKIKTETNSLRTATSTYEFTVNASDAMYEVDRLNVWINDVPLYGIKGLDLRSKKSKSYVTKLKTNLSVGQNKIQVSCHNKKGMESLRETIEITYSPDVPPKPNLYLVAISVSDYQNNKYDLKYARKDGKDLVKLLGNLGNDFNEVIIDTLFDQDAVLENVAKIKGKLMLSSVDDQVIVFVAGHGILDKNYDFYFASYDMDFNDPAKRGVSYGRIEDILDGIPARKKLLLIDACHSGEVDKEGFVKSEKVGDAKLVSGWAGRGGGSTVESVSGIGLSNSFELMQELFANLSRGSGAVVISAAAGDEFALESNLWKNGVFTFCIKEALSLSSEGRKKGDFNNDGSISVNELKKYVSEKVQEKTNGRQKPTSRRENLELDFVIW